MKRPHLARNEDGIAVLTVIFASALMIILGGTMFLVAATTMERATAETENSRALNTAEAGLETTAAKIVANPALANPYIDTLDDGSQFEVQWSANVTGLPWWTLTSTGYHKIGAERWGKRTVTAQVFALNPWDFQYAGGMSGATVNGNVWVKGPFYVNDTLELTGTAGVHGGPLIIYDTTGPGDGDLLLNSNSADIGSPGNNVALFIDGTVTNTAGSYYADPVYRWAPALEFPELTEAQLNYYRWDNNGGSDPSPWLADVERPVALLDVDTGVTTDKDTPLTLGRRTFVAKLNDNIKHANEANPLVTFSKSGNHITIQFNNATGVKPILFVDGNVTFGDNQTTVSYTGIGTIVSSWNIAVKGSLAPSGSSLGSNETGALNGFPEQNALGLIAFNDAYYEGHTSDWLAAALYTGQQATFAQQGNFKGSAVTRMLNLGVNVPHLYTQPGFSTKLPPRMPGDDARINSIIGWTELSPPSGGPATMSTALPTP